jgi:hypothetical protein
MKDVVTIAGVPLVRVAKQYKAWYVQTRQDENSDNWTTVSEPFSSKDEALDQASVICEF